MKKAKLVLFAIAMILTACADKDSSDSGSSASGSGSTGPAAYHTVYSNIQQSLVKIKNFRLRTVDGEVINVPTAVMEVNLQDLQGVTKGLAVNLAGITFPASAATIDIVEVETDLVLDGSARTISADGSICKLSTPHRKLNFYTGAPVTIIAGEQYLVKVNYTALNAIQIDIVTKKDCECGDDHDDKVAVQETGKGGSHSHGECVEGQIQRCELVNRRHAVLQIIRPIDEF